MSSDEFDENEPEDAVGEPDEESDDEQDRGADEGAGPIASV
jgi:hypothetical protein